MNSPAASRQGILFGIGAYGLWGLIPLYFKAVAHVAPAEVLAHRALWSFVVLVILVRSVGRWGEIWRALGQRKLAFMLGLSGLFIAANWLLFIYAVASRQVLEASLGYFINPLVNVLFGVALLRERLRPYQCLSIALAAVGVLVLTAMVGQMPWLALALALTFGLYGLMRKLMPVDGLVSLTVETLAMLPFAIGYIVYLGAVGKTTGSGTATLGLLMLSGVVTTVPLLFFGAAARRLRLSTMGILQYLTPTLQFSLAVAVFKEPFSSAQLVSFACIWLAILVYTADALRATRLRPIEVVEPD